MSDFFGDLWDDILDIGEWVIDKVATLIGLIIMLGMFLGALALILGIFGLCTNSHDSEDSYSSTSSVPEFLKIEKETTFSVKLGDGTSNYDGFGDFEAKLYKDGGAVINPIGMKSTGHIPSTADFGGKWELMHMEGSYHDEPFDYYVIWLVIDFGAGSEGFAIGSDKKIYDRPKIPYNVMGSVERK